MGLSYGSFGGFRVEAVEVLVVMIWVFGWPRAGGMVRKWKWSLPTLYKALCFKL